MAIVRRRRQQTALRVVAVAVDTAAMGIHRIRRPMLRRTRHPRMGVEEVAVLGLAVALDLGGRKLALL